MARTRAVAMSLAILSILALSTLSFAAAPDRITGAVSAGQTVRLTTGVPLRAKPQFDQGRVDPSLKMTYLTLLTKPTAAQQQAINKLLADQQNPRSASYHKWLTPEQYASRFGLSQNDVKKITTWLQSEGFTVVKTARGRNFIVFNGTAAQVDKTFQTQLHNFKVNDEIHYANTTPPVIPAALSGVVSGFRGFNNFRAKTQAHRAKHDYTFPVEGGDLFYIAPGDVATMYDLNTLYTNGIDGTGQAIAVIGETDVYLDDLADFRSGFGLSAISCTTSNTDVITACNTSNFAYILIPGDEDPGAPDSLGDDLPEADIDLEYSGATARGAQIVYVNAPDPDGNGIYDSMYYAIDNTVAPVMTMSYSFPCELAEAYDGTYTADEAEFQMANAEGMTFMNSAGDTGAAECDYGNSEAVYGYALAYPASSPEITGVGGTLIPYNEYTDSYWGTANGTNGGSLSQYAPENVWNDAQQWSIYCTANPSNSTCSGNAGLNSWQTAQETYIGLDAGGGGVSNCVIVDENGVCTSGIPQPSYQNGISLASIDPGNGGVLNTPVRYSPDVSLLASIYWPGYIICTADSELGGGDNNSACSPGGAQGIINNMTNYGFTWGGTSISTPIFAGMVAMLNQYLNGSSQAGLGNINGTLYTLAATPANGAFHQVNVGSNGAWCEAGTPSSGDSEDPWPTNLVCPSSGPNLDFIGFNASNSDATTGYNAAVGLGSVDAGNLFAAWATAGLSSTTTTLQSSENPSKYGDSVTFTATVTTTGNDTPTGTVTFYDGSTALGPPVELGCICDGRNGIPLSATATFTTSTLSPGTHPITAVYGGDSNNAGSTSTPALNQVVTAPTFNVTTPGTPSPAPAGTSTTSTFTVTATGGATTFAGAVTFACNGLPDATVTCGFSAVPQGANSPQTVTLTINTAGPNGDDARKQQRRRADNRLPLLPMTLPLAGVVMLGFAGRKRSKYSMVAGLCVALLFAGFLIACGNSSTPPTAISVSPEGATVFANAPAGYTWPPQTAAFTATVTNNTNTAVTWSVTPSTGGTIDANGNYTAPAAVEGLPTSATVTATSQADTTKFASATVTLTPTSVPGTYPLT
ncbi:MAG: protease pro-enzyme activation domain-containing protein, partial [Terriglobales bacterium]